MWHCALHEITGYEALQPSRSFFSATLLRNTSCVHLQLWWGQAAAARKPATSPGMSALWVKVTLATYSYPATYILYFKAEKKKKSNRWIEQTMPFSSWYTNNVLQLPEFTAVKTKPQGMHNKSRWHGLCSAHKINLTLDVTHTESQQICQSFHILLSFA